MFMFKLYSFFKIICSIKNKNNLIITLLFYILTLIYVKYFN